VPPCLLAPPPAPPGERPGCPGLLLLVAPFPPAPPSTGALPPFEVLPGFPLD
jgi:hypothetical protein